MSLFSRSTSSAVAVLAALVLVMLVAVLTATGQSSSANATGILEVDAVRYEFVPSACAFNETDFVAAGSGTISGQPFWVSASSRSVTLTVGTESEVQPPVDDQVWMTSLGTVTWQADADSVEVVATMVDSRSDNSARRPATLIVACPDAT